MHNKFSLIRSFRHIQKIVLRPVSISIVLILAAIFITDPSQKNISATTFQRNRNASSDSAQLKALLLRYNQLDYTTTEELLEVTSDIVEWQKKFGSETQLAHYYNLLGLHYQSKGQYNIALKYLIAGYRLHQKIGNPKATAYSLSDIANVYFAQGFYDMALGEYKKQLQIFRSMADTHGTAVAMNNIGLSLQMTSQPDSALVWFNKALEIRRQMNDPFLIAHSKVYIGHAWLDMKKPKKADSTLREALYVLYNQPDPDLNDSVLIASALMSLGFCEQMTVNNGAATRAFESALNIHLKINNPHGVIGSYTTLAEHFYALGLHDKANTSLNNALRIGRDKEFLEEYYQALNIKCRWLAAETVGDSVSYFVSELQRTTDTLLFARKYNQASDIASALEAMQFDYDLEKSNQTSRNRLRLLLLISLSAGVASVLIFLLYQREKRNERRFRQLANSTFEGIIIHHQGKIIRANQSFLQLTGHQEFEISQLNILECFIEEDRTQLNRLFHNSLEGELQTVIICDKDKSVPVEILNRPMIFKGKKVNITAIRDITQLKKIMQENLLLRTAVEQNASAVVMTDARGIITYVNQNFITITGYSASESIGKNPSILKSGTHNEAFYGNLWKTIRKGDPWKGEFLNKKKNGDLYWENALITPVKNTAGDITHFIAIKEDITLQKQIENELQQRKNMYRELVRQLPQTAVFLFDRNHRYLLADGPLLQELGIQPQAYEGKKPGVLTQSPSDIALINDMMEKSFQGFLPVSEIKITNRICQMQTLPILETNQEISLGMLVVRDITDERESQRRLVDSEAQLRELNATKDKFFSLLAHDLKNPFNIILGYAEILSTDYDELNDQVKKEYIGQIEIGAESAFRLLNNLLEWARSQTGKIQFNPQPIDISVPINNGLQVVATQAQAKGIKIESRHKGQLWAYADLNMVRTVIRNLLTNAIKFSYPGSTVTLSTEQTEPGHPAQPSDDPRNYIMVTVEDKGTGIEPDDMLKLFKTGEKVRTDGTANETGTGLGLILCHEFIQRNQGRIWVTSKPGEGSRFMFLLPEAQSSDSELPLT